MTNKLSELDIKAAKATKRMYARKYYHANKARSRAYYLKNKDKIKSRAEAWRRANRERYLKQQAAYDATTRVITREFKRSSDKFNEPFSL